MLDGELEPVVVGWRRRTQGHRAMARGSAASVDRNLKRTGTGSDPIRRGRGTSATRNDSYSKLPFPERPWWSNDPGQSLR